MSRQATLSTPGIFHGWFVVAAAFAVTLVGFGCAYTFSAFLALAAAGLRRLARLGLAGVFARRLPLFRPRHRQRPARRPLWLAPPRGCRHAPDRARACRGERRAQPDRGLRGLRPRRRSRRRLRLCAGDRRGAALVRAAARLCLRACGERHRRRHAGDAAAGVAVDRHARMARRLSRRSASSPPSSAAAWRSDRERSARPRPRPRRRSAARRARNGSARRAPRSAKRSARAASSALYAACLICSFGLFVPFVHLVPYARDHGVAAVRPPCRCSA